MDHQNIQQGEATQKFLRKRTTAERGKPHRSSDGASPLQKSEEKFGTKSTPPRCSKIGNRPKRGRRALPRRR